MSTYMIKVLGNSWLAGADLSADRYKAMTLSAGKLVRVSTRGGTGVGVLANEPTLDREGSVEMFGIHPVKFGGTVAALDALTVNASGLFVKRTSDDESLWGLAVEAAVANDVRTAYLSAPTSGGQTGVVDGAGFGSFRATYDVSSGADSGAIGVHGLGVFLPNNAVVTRSYYNVATTFTSAGADAGTIALGIAVDDTVGIVAATAISAGGNVWDAGWHDGIQDGAVANYSETTTAERELIATTAGQIITAGKLILFGDYKIVD